MKKWKRLLITPAVGLALIVSAGSASAHGLTVETPGGQTPLDQPVSTGWAQAHCNAEAPAQATDNSGGVVTFSPADILPCPTGPGEGAPGR